MSDAIQPHYCLPLEFYTSVEVRADGFNVNYHRAEVRGRYLVGHIRARWDEPGSAPRGSWLANNGVA